MKAQAKTPSVSDAVEEFKRFGGTDVPYLQHHFDRFSCTKNEFCASWDRNRGLRVLDVGAHWLHQSYLWVIDGFSVTAVDLPITFEIDSVQRFAQEHAIRLISCADLASASALEAIESDSVDIMLFTEIIEHITFNPVRFWKQIYRVLAPGARIVVTTPNYYAVRGRAWNFRRFRQGFGGGISVDEVLNTNTYGHHWREYSMKELIRYFCLLSPDFNVVKQCYPDSFGLSTDNWRHHFLERRFAALRPNLHLEVELTAKASPIALEPSW